MIRAVPLGDSALTLTLGEGIDAKLNLRVHHLAARLAAAPLAGIRELTPAYNSLLIHYDPLLLSYAQVETWVLQHAAPEEETAAQPARCVEIPTRYGGEYGPDLEFVARHNGLTPAEVIQIHTAAEYTVYLMGFTPGFPYLGGMDERIAAPRLASPRTSIPAGSVGIAGQQTGIYPLASPGGWQLIGRTAIPLFNPHAEAPCLLSPGDHLRFVAIDD